MPKTVVTFSGGLDSTTLLWHLREQGHEVYALAVDYGQRHRIELQRARAIAEAADVPFEVADLSSMAGLLAGSSQTDSAVDVPLGHYAEDNMKQTVVPNRNMLLLAAATALAIREKADHVAYAAHAGDHTIYPDCRPEFADAMAQAIALCDWHRVKLIRPFVDKSKADIVLLGAAISTPFDMTWSCYQGDATGEGLHCGACGTCIERREAFIVAGVADPTRYRDTAPRLTVADGKLEIDWSTTHQNKSMPADAVPPSSD